jgi:adenylate cyclase class 2
MREIEVKAKVKDKEILLQALQNAGCELGDPIVQEDTVYVRNVGNLETFLANDYFLRIRECDDGSVYFTFKKPKSNRLPKVDSLDKVEYEMKIDNKEACVGILGELGFSKQVYTKKSRRKAKWNSHEICVDEAENLGTFIEIEKMAGEDENIEDVEKELLKILVFLGVDLDDRIMQGYDILTIMNGESKY